LFHHHHHFGCFRADEVDYITLFFLFVCGSGIQAHFGFYGRREGRKGGRFYLCILVRRVFVTPLRFRFWFAYYFHLPFSFVSLAF
jgi:hypothetical protein